MSILSQLLHRSLGSTLSPTQQAYTDLASTVTNALYRDLEFDDKARFTIAGGGGGRRANGGLSGHAKGVTAIAVDGTERRWMVTGGAEAGLLVWDLEGEVEVDGGLVAVGGVGKSEGHKFGISSIRFHPHDSSLFTTTSYDKTLKIFSTSTPSNPSLVSTYALESIAYSHSTSSASLSPVIAVVTASPHIRLIDPRAARATQTLFGHTTPNLSVAWSPKYASILASGSSDGTVRLWDVRFGASCLGSLDAMKSPSPANRAAGTAHHGGVNGLVWSADGGRLISAGMDHRIRVWGMEDGRNTNVIFPPVVRNKFQAEMGMVLVESECEPGILFVGNGEEVVGFDVGDGGLVCRLKLPREIARGKMGRISGLACRGGGMVELYTSHTMGKEGYDGGRENVMRWRPAFLMLEDDDDDDDEREKTEKQRRLEEIFDSLTKAPVRFG